MNNTHTSKLMVAFMALSAIALIVGMYLVNQNQETRKGAYFAGSKLFVLPDTITGTVGAEVPVQLWVETDNNAKISAVDTTFCYGDGLILDATDVTSLISLNTEAFRLIEFARNQNKCLRLFAVSSGIDSANLKSGVIKVATIRFKATAVGTGSITINKDVSITSGFNAGSTDTGIKVNVVTGASYTIADTGSSPTPTPPNVSISPTPTLPGSSPTPTPPNVSDIPTITSSPTATPTLPTSTLTPSPTLTLIPTATPIVGAVNPILKFRMSVYGVNPNAMCATVDKMPLIVTVRAPNGTSKAYSGVPVVKANTTTSPAFYDVTLQLTDFNYTDNLAVFIKSPKSLQVKYGKNNQNSYYEIAGGELSGLTTVESTTPTFKFEGYPLLVGDVTGPNGVQDGSIDGLDFTYVKTEANKRTKADDGGYMLADLNGNCQMESQDLSNLMLSLSVKQGQLY